jgi:hypothetical protein
MSWHRGSQRKEKTKHDTKEENILKQNKEKKKRENIFKKKKEKEKKREREKNMLVNIKTKLWLC